MHLIKSYLLIADDDPEDISVLLDGLRLIRSDIPVKTVNNGRSVMDFLHHCKEDNLPGLILLDFKMPFLNAAEVLLAMSENEEWSAIPKLVWSTNRQGRDIELCLNLGAIDYLRKPDSLVELKELSQRILDVWSAVS